MTEGGKLIRKIEGEITRQKNGLRVQRFGHSKALF